MTKRTTLVLLIALLFCAPAARSDDQAKLQVSQKTWQQLNKKHNGNYSYKVRWSSFAGFGHETEIVVRNNKVAERRFRSFSGRPVEPGKPTPEHVSWIEKGDDVGSHKEGAAPKTLDELYAEAAKVLERDLADHERRYVRFNKQGLLLSCFTVDRRIADDAPTKGVTITSISLGAAADGSGPLDKQVYKAPNGKAFPRHWGEPPRIQTRDLRPLPGGYGKGSGTLANWIQENLDRDAEKAETNN